MPATAAFDLASEQAESAAKAVISSVLEAQGWQLSTGTAVAVKLYATAVGPKEAHAYLGFNRRPDEPNWSLYGVYWTEGRNCLESDGVLLRKDAAADTLAELALKFCSRVDQSVQSSYAARLLTATN